MRARMFLMFAVVVAFAVTVSGCATYGGLGMVPDLNNPSSLAAKEKMTTRLGDGLNVTMYPVTSKDEVDKYFDEDLLDKGIMPVFVEIYNEGENVELIAATFNNGSGAASSMAPNDVYEVVKRGWVGRATFWMFPTYFVGAPISAAATYYTNAKIQKDLGVEGDEGKILKLGKILSGSTVRGFLCFRCSVSPGTAGQKKFVKLIFQRGGRLIERNLDIL